MRKWKFDRGLYEDPQKQEVPDYSDREKYPFYDNPFTKKERFRFSLIALAAALIIGGIFLLGIFIVILIIAKPWLWI